MRVRVAFADEAGAMMAEAWGFSRCVVPIDDSLKLVGDLLHHVSTRFGLQSTTGGLEVLLDGFVLLPSDKIALVLRADDVLTVQWSTRAAAAAASITLQTMPRLVAAAPTERKKHPSRATTTKPVALQRANASSSSSDNESSSGEETSVVANKSPPKKPAPKGAAGPPPPTPAKRVVPPKTTPTTATSKRSSDSSSSSSSSDSSSSSSSESEQEVKTKPRPLVTLKEKKRLAKAGTPYQRSATATTPVVSAASSPKKRPAAVAFPEAQDATSAAKARWGSTSAPGHNHVRFDAKANASFDKPVPDAKLSRALDHRPRGGDLAKYGPSAAPLPSAMPAPRLQQRQAPVHRTPQPATATSKKELWKRPYQVIASLETASMRATATPEDAFTTYPEAQIKWVQAGDVVAFKTLRLCETTMTPVLSAYQVGRCVAAETDALVLQPCVKTAQGTYEDDEAKEPCTFETMEVQDLRALAGAAHVLGQLQCRVVDPSTSAAAEEHGSNDEDQQQVDDVGATRNESDENDEMATAKENLLEMLRARKEQLLREQLEGNTGAAP
ncbi:hypothetical protein, variant [Saprolegnia diclina VS20]|uniref:Coilin N-terminal domain-containing protein n=1 Tax=Saprolegnia diclina (strain VS20) TaxID=1156394 RepID=T0SE07_SAPDV|nr:hypothetical protein SDRG_02146 [Saprolegnia diclina VS20]XP_008605941.1 hypothetical protein, variant [Saprolegnia diclina VS20]EQC41096.1 hypothetical protein SDRG_02146 [Saprolegnia diclina VS20]EQC41097.1 hypothetical protein, variant [Saprolegnia diclina VS20]|eukprot:XP_008605940.1 hypothetical protein SDRG_02146 [Saprolegnia diclina VS20]